MILKIFVHDFCNLIKDLLKFTNFLSLSFEHVCKPTKGFLKPGSFHCRGLKHLPLAILDLIQTKSCGNLIVIHSTCHVLFIGKDEDGDTLELIFRQHDLELLLGELKSLSISRIDHKHHSFCVLIVTSPIGSETRLTTKVPYLKFEPLVVYSFHIEAHCWHCRYDLS